MTDKKTQLAIVFHPLRGDGSNLSMSSFSTIIEGFRKVASKFNCTDLDILNLTSNSPVTMSIEGEQYLSSLYGGLYHFMDTREMPDDWNRGKIDSVLDFITPVGKTIGTLDFSLEGEKELVINSRYKADFENKIEPDFFALGTIDGTIEAINIHGRKNTVALYPTIGSNKIVLEFDDQYLDTIKNLIGFYVEISGEMKYKWRDKYPHSGTIEKIEPIVEENLPTFSEMYGMAPNATSGLPAEDFIAGIRSE